MHVHKQIHTHLYEEANSHVVIKQYNDVANGFKSLIFWNAERDKGIYFETLSLLGLFIETSGKTWKQLGLSM
jgi:hypothetical protein